MPARRARGNGVPFPFSGHGLRPGRSRLDSPSFPLGLVNLALTHVIPALTHVILALTHVILALTHVIPALTHVILALTHVILALTHVIPAKAGISRCAIQRVARSYRHLAVIKRNLRFRLIDSLPYTCDTIVSTSFHEEKCSTCQELGLPLESLPSSWLLPVETLRRLQPVYRRRQPRLRQWIPRRAYPRLQPVYRCRQPRPRQWILRRAYPRLQPVCRRRHLRPCQWILRRAYRRRLQPVCQQPHKQKRALSFGATRREAMCIRRLRYRTASSMLVR